MLFAEEERVEEEDITEEADEGSKEERLGATKEVDARELLPMKVEGSLENVRVRGRGRETGALNERAYPFAFSRVFEMIELDEGFDDEEEDQPR